ncbi:hypothetical protein MKW94_001618 [Papaver nudicaule]|uniref:Ribosomal protein S9 n=2 Tax=Papaver nudicaule TaxID=74823 RepID=A0AA41S977_PAPNU|nr:hypothetical protein [Papaver nudicaule]
MLSRIISRSSSQLRFLPLISLNPNSPISQNSNLILSRYFSSNNYNGNDKKVSNLWSLGGSDNDNGDGEDSIFSTGLERIDECWGKKDSSFASGFFGDNEVETNSSKNRNSGFKGGDGGKTWSFVEEDQKEVFDLSVEEMRTQEEEFPDHGEEEKENELLEIEKKNLLQQLNGPDRAFGDLIAASGITEEMIESMILLKDLKGVEGFHPLSELKDLPKNDKNERKSTNSEIERRKQEEVAKARVRQVDDKGRAYGTGRRKCSIARVWVQPGDGRFSINDKSFDVYFPILDHRAAILGPFSETKTLGLWDVKCTVQGGGLSGQVGAVQLGISRALQNWEPGLRPYLKTEGFLTRDSRVVERKKPGLAKARKSFQWVKR